MPYPKHPPLVSFRTELTRFPKPALLNITKKLMREAMANAKYVNDVSNFEMSIEKNSYQGTKPPRCSPW